MTQDQQAAGVANNVLALMQQAYQFQQTINQVALQWTNLSAATLLSNFNTAPLLASGALGTADGSPNTAHPIDTRTAPGSELNAAVSEANLASMMTALQGFANAMGGTAVSANGAVPQLVALALTL